MVIVAREVANIPNIFLNRKNQHTQEINGHFDWNLNYYGPMVFAANEEQRESYTFQDMLLQLDK